MATETEKQLKQALARIAALEAQGADRAASIVMEKTREQILSRREALMAQTKRTKHGTGTQVHFNKHYYIEEPAYVLGKYYEAGSTVTVPEDHEPSHKWHPVDAKGQPIGVELYDDEGDPQDAELLAEDEEPSDEEEGSSAPTPPVKGGKKAKRPSDEEVA